VSYHKSLDAVNTYRVSLANGGEIRRRAGGGARRPEQGSGGAGGGRGGAGGDHVEVSVVRAASARGYDSVTCCVEHRPAPTNSRPTKA
jgi:hypothetical protein